MNIINLLFTNGHMGGRTDTLIISGIGVILMITLMGLLTVAQRVLFALAAYHDACSKSNPDAVMWGLLIGFLGFIPGIIYLCVRNSSRRFTICSNCGCSHYAYDINCPRCGAPNQNPLESMNPFAAQQAHRAKGMLTAAIIMIGAEIILGIICAVSFTMSVFSMAGSSVIY